MITIIAAMANHRVIGNEGKIPFEEKADKLHFKSATTGKIVVMGRVTYESIGRPLPNRVNIVLTRDKTWSATGVIVERSAEDCIASVTYLSQTREIMIIGGEEVYRLFLPHAQQMVITHVNAYVDGDTFFPQFDMNEWDSKVIVHQTADSNNQYPFVIRRYTRK